MESNTRRRVWARGWQDFPQFNREWNSAFFDPAHWGIVQILTNGTYQLRLFFSFENNLSFDIFDNFATWEEAIERGGLIPEW